MWRLVRALFKKLFGWTGAFAESLEEDPDVLAQTFDDSIDKSKDRVAETKKAIAKLMVIHEDRSRAYNNVSENIETLKKRRDGALARAQQLVKDLQSKGVAADAILRGPEIIRARQTHADVSADLEKKINDSKDKEKDLKKFADNLNMLKAKLQSMQRNASSLEEEKQATIADVVSAKEQAAVDDLLSGVSQDTADKDLERARAARKNVNMRAKLSSEMAGLDATASGEDYEKYASTASANSEFDSLLGLETKPVSENKDPARLPE